MTAPPLPERRAIDLAFLFCHPSRCGGGPVRDMLQSVFSDRFRAEYNTAPETLRFEDVSEASFMFDLVCRYQPRPILAVSANFLIVPAFVGPVNGSVPYGTVLRDPVERICSEFAAFKSLVDQNPHSNASQKAAAKSVEAFAETFNRHNFFVRFFSQTEVWEPATDGTIQAARQHIDRFSLVMRPDRDGLTAAVEKLIDLLPSEFRDPAAAWRAANEARLGRTDPTNGARLAASLPAAVRSSLEQANAFDMDFVAGQD